jgi:hypothetical protein
MKTTFRILEHGAKLTACRRVLRRWEEHQDSLGVGAVYCGGGHAEIFDLREGEGWDTWTPYRAAKRLSIAVGFPVRVEF